MGFLKDVRNASGAGAVAENAPPPPPLPGGLVGAPLPGHPAPQTSLPHLEDPGEEYYDGRNNPQGEQRRFWEELRKKERVWRAREEATTQAREMNGVAPQQAPLRKIEEPPKEIIEFTPAAWDLAERLGLDPDWIVSVVEPSGKRCDMLVKDVKRAAAMRDAAEKAAAREEAAAEDPGPALQHLELPVHEKERPKDDTAMLEDLLKQSLEEVSGHVTTIEPDG